MALAAGDLRISAAEENKEAVANENQQPGTTAWLLEKTGVDPDTRYHSSPIEIIFTSCWFASWKQCIGPRIVGVNLPEGSSQMISNGDNRPPQVDNPCFDESLFGEILRLDCL